MRRTVGVGLTFVLAAACSSGSDDAPTFGYGAQPLLLRAGQTVELPGLAVLGEAFTVEPALPAGLQLDPSTGTIHGSPTAAAPAQTFTVRGMFGRFELTATLQLAIGAALPAEVTSLEAGFAIERIADLTQAPGKFAIAPDGRAFVTERGSGVIRIVDTDGTLLATPFATVSVTTGSHRGLLGLALSPTFASDARVFALATTPAGGGKPERSVLYRWTEAVGIGQAQVVLLDDLPVASINNGGALCFDATGMLLVSIGDTEDPTLAQSDSSLAGKLLRIDPEDGSVPADNPNPASAIFAKGFRNTWALAIEPTAGTVFGADNGPTNDDELNFVQPGRNFEWGAAPGADFGAVTGVQLRRWPDVVVPTGLAFGDAAAQGDWPAMHQRSLFLSFYDEEVVLRFELSGALRTDIDREVEFLRLLPSGIDNKPVDLLRGPDGSLWLLTFAALYRIDRIR